LPGLRTPLVGLEVKYDGAFAPVPGSESWLLAGRVSTRTLNFNDIGPLVGQQHAQQRPGNVVAEVQHPNAAQGPGWHLPILSVSRLRHFAAP
jgi:hypothetical protein